MEKREELYTEEQFDWREARREVRVELSARRWKVEIFPEDVVDELEIMTA